MELRPFQHGMVTEARAGLRQHPAILVQLPTGGGKTVLSAFMMQSAYRKGGRPWFLCHRDFLVDQTSKTLERVGVPHAFVAAGRRFNPWEPGQVCSIDTLRGRLNRIPRDCMPTVAFVDEGHHACSASWAKIIRWLIENGCKVVGLSATPERLDRKGLDELFGHMVLGPTTEWLIENKYLSDYTAFAPDIPNVEDVASRGGDFNASELEGVMDNDTLTGNIVSHYKRVALGKRAVYFAVSVRHSQHIVSAFRQAGITAIHLDANSSSDERRSAARSMAIGELDVISNVGLFGEGYDLAAQAGMDVTIEAVGLCRPTQSLAMYLQQVGRVLRPKDYPGIILDHAGNILRHGLPDMPREWSLAPKRPAGRKKAGPALDPVKVCPNCFATAAAQARVCPFCEEPYPVKDERTMKENDADLVAIDKDEAKRLRKAQEHSAKSLDDLVRVGIARGYKEPERWAAHLWTVRERAANKRAEEQARQQRFW